MEAEMQLWWIYFPAVQEQVRTKTNRDHCPWVRIKPKEKWTSATVGSVVGISDTSSAVSRPMTLPEQLTEAVKG